MDMRTTRETRSVLARVIAVTLVLAVVAAVPSPARATFVRRSDLTITGSSSTPGVKQGLPLTFALTVVNEGPDAAFDVSVEVVLDPRVAVRGADASDGVCVVAVVAATCTLASLRVGESFTLSVRSTATTPGWAKAAAAAESTSVDDAPAGNVVTSSTEIGPESSPCDLWGTARKDKIRGSRRNEVVCGRGGNDRLVGRRGKDRLIGGPGADRLIGGPGRDRMFGGAGKDRCPGNRRDLRRSCV